MQPERFEQLIDFANNITNAELAFLLGIMRDRIGICTYRKCTIDGDNYHSIESISSVNLNGHCVMLSGDMESL